MHCSFQTATVWRQVLEDKHVMFCKSRLPLAQLCNTCRGGRSFYMEELSMYLHCQAPMLPSPSTTSWTRLTLTLCPIPGDSCAAVAAHRPQAPWCCRSHTTTAFITKSAAVESECYGSQCAILKFGFNCGLPHSSWHPMLLYDAHTAWTATFAYACNSPCWPVLAP